MNKLQMFYRSKAWERFVKRLRIERTNADGFLICEHCGQPIVKAYDCIGHHIEELTDDNVDDVTISLNPANIQLVHFKCHNEIHKRFGYAERRQQNVYIIYGAPCSGKREFVRGVSDSDDLILDIDRLWAAIRSDSCTNGEKPNAIKTNVFALRDYMIDMIRVRRGRWNNAYIIGGYPLQGERERLADNVGADKIILVDADKESCLQRAKLISDEMNQYVNDWFDRYTPPL